MAKKAIDEILQKEKDCDERLAAAKKKADAEYAEIIAAADKRGTVGRGDAGRADPVSEF